MSVPENSKSSEEVAREIRDIYRKMAQELHCHYSPTSEVIAILTLATVIAINANPVCIVEDRPLRRGTLAQKLQEWR